MQWKSIKNFNIFVHLPKSSFTEYLIKPDPNAKPNLNPIINEEPVFVNQVKNAKLYTIGKGDDQIYVVHLWGSPYEMGFAHGKLLPDRMKGLVETFWSYMESEIVFL